MDPVVTATVEFAIAKLLEVTAREFELVRGFSQDLTDFKKSLQMIKKLLEEAEKRQTNDEAVKLWLNELEDAAYEAEDVLDLIKYETLGRQIENRGRIEPRGKGCLNISFCSSLLFRWRMAHQMRHVKAIFTGINDEAYRFGYQKGVLDYLSFLPGVKETDVISADPDFCGRETEVENLVQQITRPINASFFVLPIVGMGGIGKTTLARRIFQDPSIEKHFDERIWVCVSDDFDDVKIFERILKELKDTSHGESRQDILKKTQEKLKDKRYLLVLDDLWNDKPDDWSDFKNAMLGVNSNQGNVVIVTTRNQSVASIVSLHNQYILGQLTNDNCWSIIKKIAFEGGDVPHDHFQTVGEEIAIQCRGSPLAAKVMGGVLRRKEIDEWNLIKEKGPSDHEDYENSVRRVLRISYDRLPSSSLKQCFAYCSIFPKDTMLSRKRLIQLWMAEEFLSDNPKIDMEATGNSFFNTLLQNSFFQESKKDKYGMIKLCKMHDFVHDLAYNIAGSKSCIIVDGYPHCDTSRVRYLSVRRKPEAMEISKEQTSRVRSLILRPGLQSINLSGFKHLHTLTLRRVDNECLISINIGELIHLKCLDLSYSFIKSLPDSICKLYSLQTLNIMGCRKLEQLPQKLQNLISLRHLCFYTNKNFLMPPRIGRLSCLQTLMFFNVSDKEGCRIEELGYLKNLQGRLEIRNLELLKDKEEAKKANLNEKTIYELVFCWSKPTIDENVSASETVNEDVSESNTNDESVMDGLQPLPNLKILKVEGFRGKNFPSWTMKMLNFHNLIEVEFVRCTTCKEIPMLGHLPLLKYLKLEGLDNVSSIGASFYGASECSSTGSQAGQKKMVLFPLLKSLKISNLFNLTEWAEAQTKEQVFLSLETLQIWNCPKLTTVPSNFPHLKELSMSNVGSLSLTNILSNNNLTSLVELSIWKVSKLTALPDDLFYRNQNLKHLKLHQCSMLTYVPNLMKGCTSSLQKLDIRGCHSLRQLPNDVHRLELLERLFIFDCESLELIPYKGSGQNNKCFPSLRYLSIEKCRNLRSLPGEMFYSCRSLQYLRVYNCKNITSFPKLSQMGCSNSLRKLEIGRFSDSIDFSSFQKIIDGIECFKALKELDLLGRANWVTLPDKLQHLTSLERLCISGFGVEALPEWFGNLSSLQILRLYDCEKLRHLPSNQSMQRLTKLKNVGRSNCPLLQEEWPDVENDNW